MDQYALHWAELYKPLSPNTQGPVHMRHVAERASGRNHRAAVRQDRHAVDLSPYPRSYALGESKGRGPRMRIAWPSEPVGATTAPLAAGLLGRRPKP